MPFDMTAILGKPIEPWCIVAERKITEWIDAGGIERLSNIGTKLDLRENPFLRSDLRLAYRMMENANLAPDWIELGKEIETALARCREEMRRNADANRRDRIALHAASIDASLLINRRLRARRDEFTEQQTSRYANVNHLIGRFNVACPMDHLHRLRIDVAGSVVDDLHASRPFRD